jgi:indolepyruvate ferredoxin oxidoreductase
MEQALIAGYERDIVELLIGLDAATLDIAVAIAGLPEAIRGFGHVKARNAEAARQKREELLGRWRILRQSPAKAA